MKTNGVNLAPKVSWMNSAILYELNVVLHKGSCTSLPKACFSESSRWNLPLPLIPVLLCLLMQVGYTDALVSHSRFSTNHIHRS